jgi:hypothetical protein
MNRLPLAQVTLCAIDCEVPVEPVGSRGDVADFVACRLHAHLGTSHALILRWDAGVLHPGAWSDEFLVADDLVSPGQPGDAGGLPRLSLRSRRWRRASADPRMRSSSLRGPQAATFEAALQTQGMPRSLDALQRLRAPAAALAPH